MKPTPTMLRSLLTGLIASFLVCLSGTATARESLFMPEFASPSNIREEARYLRDLVEQIATETGTYRMIPLADKLLGATPGGELQPCGERRCAFRLGTLYDADMVLSARANRQGDAVSVRWQLWNVAREKLESSGVATMQADLTDIEDVAKAFAKRVCRGEEPERDPEMARPGSLIRGDITDTLNKYPWRAEVEEGDDNGHEMLVVPSGDYFLGTSARDAERHEGPRTKIFLDSYEIAATETTQAQFREFLIETGYRGDRNESVSFTTNNATQPVYGVNYHDAVAYCAWLSVRTGQTWTLPTDAQWEAAARMHTDGPYPWGDELNVGEGETATPQNYGNFVADIRILYNGSTTLAVKPVGSFPEGKSPLGAFDMAGNVAEWCLDFFTEDTWRERDYQNPKTVGLIAVEDRVLRGGSYASSERLVRVTSRAGMPQHIRLDSVGFRVVRLTSPSSASLD